ncbi:MFS transporter [Deinococcus sp.]|uniref:MFS transporter n=1 Tax=Deinococcus sp. TaxID=47478 RepID=UPI003C7A77B4
MLRRLFLRALSGLPRNARNAILTEPLWAIFGTVVMYYAPLYMRGVGLTSTQIGLLGSLTLAFSFLFQMLAAPITNRAGRKRTTLVGDLISWTLPMFVWAFAQSFTAFVLAAILSAAGRIVSVSWSLLVIEDVDPPQRPRVFGILNLIVTGCGLLTPLVGLLMSHYGVTPTLRGVYFLGGVGMTAMFFWRNAITDETASGVAAMRRVRELSAWESLRHTAEVVGNLHQFPGLIGVSVFYALTVFTEQLGLFQILFLREALHFGVQALSYVPVVAAVVTGLLYVLALPRLAGLPVVRTLVLSRAAGLIGTGLLLLVPAGHLGGMLAVVGLLGGATFLTQTYRDAALFARLPGTGTADLYSAVQTLTMLCSVPAAALAGAVYAASSRGLITLISAMSAVLLFLALWIARGEHRRQAASLPAD